MRIEFNVKDPLSGEFKLRYPELDDISYPEEHTQNETKLYMIFDMENPWIVEGAYQDVCIALDDRRQQQDEEGFMFSEN